MPSSGWTASWPPSAAPIAYGDAGVVGAGDERVVAALAVLAPDRVDRREVEDVEAVLGDRGDLLLDRVQAAPRAREQLVPGAEARAHAVDLDRQRLGQRGGVGAQADALDGGGDLGAERRVVARRLGQARRRAGWRPRSRASPGRPRPSPSAAAASTQHRALGQLAAEVVLAGVDLAVHLVAPGGEHVAPGLDRELPAARRLDRELALPAHAVDVRVDRVHRRLEPAPAARRLVADDGAHDLVAVAEDVGGDLDRVADAALGRVTSAVDGRRGMVDQRPGGSFVALRGGHLTAGVSNSRPVLTTSHATSPGPAASSCTPPRSPAGGSAARPSLRRLAGGGGADVVADAAARAARPARLAVQVRVGVRGVAGAAGRRRGRR